MTALLDDLWLWITTLPAWQSDLLRRVVACGELDEADVGDLAQMVLASAKPGTVDVAPQRMARDDLPIGSASAPAPTLAGLRDVRNIGALDQGTQVSFAPRGLNVVFGFNGSGKSTLARLLKHACTARHRDDALLPNVYSGPAGPQSYVLELHGAAGVEPRKRSAGDRPDPALTDIAVFDAASADLYVSSPGEMTFVPRELTFLPRLARAQECVRTALRKEKTELQARIAGLEPLPHDGSALTSARLIEASRWHAADEGRLRELEGLLTRVRDAEAHHRRARADAEEVTALRDALEELERSSSQESLLDLRELERAAAALDAQAEAAAREMAQTAIGGVGGTAWRAMWMAAESYWHQHATDLPLGERCALCQQPLSGDDRARFDRFVRLAHDELHSKSDALRRDAAQMRAALTRTSIRLESVRLPASLGDALCLSLAAWRDAALGRVRAALSGEELASPTPLPAAGLAERAEELTNVARRYASLLDPAGRAALQREHDDLQRRRELSRLRPVLEQRARFEAQIEGLELAIKQLDTRRITAKQKELTNRAVTAVLHESLRRELAALGGSADVGVQASGRAGRTLVGVQLQEAKKIAPLRVLSTGEQRLVALAFFLAEVGAAPHDAPIVLDDPVSSLDHVRRRHVARRLVEESRKRQVIVFTHDPALLMEIERARESAGLDEPHVLHCRSRGGRAGLVTAEWPWPAASCEKMLGRLQGDLRRLRKHDAERNVDAYEREVGTVSNHLRQAWERGVESLFGGVVRRGDPAVHTRQLQDVVPLEPELVAHVQRSMTECSFELHDHRAGDRAPPPSLSELDARVTAYQRFLELMCRARSRTSAAAE